MAVISLESWNKCQICELICWPICSRTAEKYNRTITLYDQPTLKRISKWNVIIVLLLLLNKFSSFINHKRDRLKSICRNAFIPEQDSIFFPFSLQSNIENTIVSIEFTSHPNAREATIIFLPLHTHIFRRCQMQIVTLSYSFEFYY